SFTLGCPAQKRLQETGPAATQSVHPCPVDGRMPKSSGGGNLFLEGEDRLAQGPQDLLGCRVGDHQAPPAQGCRRAHPRVQTLQIAAVARLLLTEGTELRGQDIDVRGAGAVFDPVEET